MTEFTNPSTDEIHALLARSRRIAVLGASPRPGRPSHMVTSELIGFGYDVIPVRPATESVLGRPCYPDLDSVPGEIDLVDVFRAAEHIPAIVDDCIRLGIPAIWLQSGIIHHAACLRARDAGMTVVQDRCSYMDYLRFRSEGRAPLGAA